MGSTEAVGDGGEPTVRPAGSFQAICPGVCVASHISSYCEAVLNVEGLCKVNMQCCVTKSLFGDAQAPPELVISHVYALLNSSQLD